MSSDLPATRTSLLHALDNGAREQNLISLGVFYERYRRGLARYLERRFQVQAQDADDILHDFLIHKIADASLINAYLNCRDSSASGHRSFRPYLVRALANYTLEKLRNTVHVANLEMIPSEAVLDSEFADLYTLEWVQTLLTATFQQVRRHYIESGNEVHWLLFIERWIVPLVQGIEPPTYEQLASKYSLASPKQVGNALTNALRTLRRQWRETLSKDLGTTDASTLAEAMNDARSSLKMTKYLDGMSVLGQLVPAHLLDDSAGRSTEPSHSDHDDCTSDSQPFVDLFGLLSDGFENLLSIEQRLLFESYLASPLSDLVSGAFDGGSVKEILADPEPSVDELRRLSRSLKNSMRTQSFDAPIAVAGVIRFLLIATAQLRCNECISSASNEELRSAMTSVLREQWIDESSRNIIERFLAANNLGS